jgi:hypothetical protein
LGGVSKSVAEFKTQIASDVVHRDGLGVELIDPSGNVVAEVFRSDPDHTLVVCTFGNEIPFQPMRDLLERAWRDLGPFEDGTPLSEARIFPARPFQAK